MRALLVDLYDTIAWLDWSVLGAQLCRRLSVDMDELFRAFMLTRPSRSVGKYGSFAGDLGALATACGRELSPALLQEIAAETIALSREHVHLYDDVLPVTRELRRRGVRIAVVSNCDHVTIPLVRELELERDFDAVILSCQVGSHKPDAAIFGVALERIAATPADATFVDDQAAYLDGAAALGLRTFHMLRDPGLAHELGTKHEVISDFGALLSSMHFEH